MDRLQQARYNFEQAVGILGLPHEIELGENQGKRKKRGNEVGNE